MKQVQTTNQIRQKIQCRKLVEFTEYDSFGVENSLLRVCEKGIRSSHIFVNMSLENLTSILLDMIQNRTKMFLSSKHDLHQISRYIIQNNNYKNILLTPQFMDKC